MLRLISLRSDLGCGLFKLQLYQTLIILNSLLTDFNKTNHISTCFIFISRLHNGLRGNLLGEGLLHLKLNKANLLTRLRTGTEPEVYPQCQCLSKINVQRFNIVQLGSWHTPRELYAVILIFLLLTKIPGRLARILYSNHGLPIQNMTKCFNISLVTSSLLQ